MGSHLTSVDEVSGTYFAVWAPNAQRVNVIGAFNDWTLTIVRTDIGREILIKMLEDGTIEGRPGDDDPGAIALLRKLSRVSRKRWPETAVAAPRLMPPPAPKPPAPEPATA